MSQENDTPPHQSAATWQLLGGRFALLLNEERAILQAGSSRNLAVFFAHWNCDEPDPGYLQQEKDRRRALVREARLSAALYAHCFDPKVIAADETNFGFFCLFALRGTPLDFQERLQTLMTEAGNALEPTESTKGMWCWLHHLFRYLQESESELVAMANARNGVISKVCEASVAFCACLERLEHERAAQKDEQPSPAQKSEKPVQSELVEKGRFCDQVIGEIRRIRNLTVSSGRSVAEIEKEHPDFAAWKVRTSLSPDDQETFSHPRQWGPPVGYAKMVLSKTHGVSQHTINSWVKAYRKGQKTRRA